jgi:hypothetical protein
VSAAAVANGLASLTVAKEQRARASDQGGGEALTSEPRVSCNPPLGGVKGACPWPANAAGFMPGCCLALVENGAGASPLGVHLASSAVVSANVCGQARTLGW